MNTYLIMGKTPDWEEERKQKWETAEVRGLRKEQELSPQWGHCL